MTLCRVGIWEISKSPSQSRDSCALVRSTKYCANVPVSIQKTYICPFVYRVPVPWCPQCFYQIYHLWNDVVALAFFYFLLNYAIHIYLDLTLSLDHFFDPTGRRSRDGRFGKNTEDIRAQAPDRQRDRCSFFVWTQAHWHSILPFGAKHRYRVIVRVILRSLRAVPGATSLHIVGGCRQKKNRAARETKTVRVHGAGLIARGSYI